MTLVLKLHDGFHEGIFYFMPFTLSGFGIAIFFRLKN